LSLILTNSEARKLLSDVSLIGRDLFARGAVKIADAARPDPEALARVDEAAPSSDWKPSDGQVRTTEQSLTLSSETPGRSEQTVEQLKDAQGNAVAEPREPQSDSGNSENKAEATRLGPRGWIKGLKDKIPQEHRDNANNGFEKGVQVLKDEFPEERRDQVCVEVNILMDLVLSVNHSKLLVYLSPEEGPCHAIHPKFLSD
jgi:Family of unknown function (DUF5923)